jgi:ATPase subunit of ABC transporter with duplicated ATPase domains
MFSRPLFLVVASHLTSQLKHEGSAIVPALKTTRKLFSSNSDAEYHSTSPDIPADRVACQPSPQRSNMKNDNSLSLNQGQEEATNAVFQFLFSADKEFSVSGPAGTGKTTLMKHIFDHTL